jgi:hypothetical protein
MSIDQFFNYSGWLVGVAGFAFGIWQYKMSQSRLVIKELMTGLLGHGSISSGSRTVEVTAISIRLENKGLQAARCSGLVHFARSTGLPLHPNIRGRAQQSEHSFLIDGRDGLDLVAAWNLQDGIIAGGIPYADFVSNYLPATVVITSGTRTITKTLTEHEVVAAHQRFEQQCFQMGS